MNRQFNLNGLLGLSGPKVWYSNINWEQTVRTRARLPQIGNAAGDRLVRRLDQHQLFLAGADDTVLVHEQPDETFLDYLRNCGIRLPRIVVGTRDDQADLFEGGTAVPYLVDEAEDRFLESLRCRRIGPPPGLALELNDKVRTRMLCERHGFTVCDGRVCDSIEALEASYLELSEQMPDARFVIKTPYGSSGKSLFHVYGAKDFAFVAAYLQRGEQRGTGEFAVTIERWHDIDYNLNAQLLLWNGECRVVAVTSQRTNDVGVYRGSDLSPFVPTGVRERYEQEMLRLGNVLLDRGYAGFLGVDSIVDRSGLLIPVIEINARLTMVTYMLPLRQHLLERSFPHIVTESFDFRHDLEIPFQQFYERIQAVLPERRKAGTVELDGRSGFLCFGYHRTFDEHVGKYWHRAFVLAWADTGETVGTIMAGVEQAIGELRSVRP